MNRLSCFDFVVQKNKENELPEAAHINENFKPKQR